ncbi:uncharacterized protein LOC144013224 [Festucalex cinctus]
MAGPAVLVSVTPVHWVICRPPNRGAGNVSGGVRSARLLETSQHLLRWAAPRLASLRATYLPGVRNQLADSLSRRGPPPGEWHLHPEVVRMIWSSFGTAEVDLFASEDSTHCPLWFSLSETTSPLGLDALAQPWPERFREFFRRGTRCCWWPPSGRPGRGSPCSVNCAPASRGVSPTGRTCCLNREVGFGIPTSAPSLVCLATEGPQPLLTGCTESVTRTILNARAPSTRLQYANRWKLFVAWCGERGVDPVSCSIPTILDFLQSLLDKGRSQSTLKVYVAAISARHVGADGCSVGRHELVSLFLRGALRLRPRPAPRVPAWDLQLVLDGLCRPPFEPLAGADLLWVSRKTALLLAVASAKRVSDLHALSVSPECLRWHPDGAGVTLWPNTAFIPKVLSGSRSNQPLRLKRYVPTPADGGDRPELLCPGRALQCYIDATAGMRTSAQLFVCYGGPTKGSALSKQRLSHWVVDAIRHSYLLSGRPLPSGVRCHSTRSIATSWAALRGVSLEDICAAASWATPCTFSRFYSVDVASPHPLGVILGPAGASQ